MTTKFAKKSFTAPIGTVGSPVAGTSVTFLLEKPSGVLLPVATTAALAALGATAPKFTVELSPDGIAWTPPVALTLDGLTPLSSFTGLTDGMPVLFGRLTILGQHTAPVSVDVWYC